MVTTTRLVLPSIGPDSPSDHKVVMVSPLQDRGAQPSHARVQYRKRYKFTESGISGLSKFLGTYDWSEMYNLVGPDMKLDYFECVVNRPWKLTAR